MTKERRLNSADWPSWMHSAWQLKRGEPGSLYPTEEGTEDGTLSIGTLEGPHLVSWGDWIIRGVNGELYQCKPDIFEATYEPVVETGMSYTRHLAANLKVAVRCLVLAIFSCPTRSYTMQVH